MVIECCHNDERLYRLGFKDESFDIWVNEAVDFSMIRSEGRLYQYADLPEKIIGQELFYVHDLQNREYSITGEDCFLLIKYRKPGK